MHSSIKDENREQYKVGSKKKYSHGPGAAEPGGRGGGKFRVPPPRFQIRSNTTLILNITLISYHYIGSCIEVKLVVGDHIST